jgi:hypothetical protein
MNTQNLNSIAVKVFHSEQYSNFLRSFADAWLKADPYHKTILKEAWTRLIQQHCLDRLLKASNFDEKDGITFFNCAGSVAVELVTPQKKVCKRILVRLVNGSRVEQGFDIVFKEGSDALVLGELEKLLHKHGFVTQTT